MWSGTHNTSYEFLLLCIGLAVFEYWRQQPDPTNLYVCEESIVIMYTCTGFTMFLFGRLIAEYCTNLFLMTISTATRNWTCVYSSPHSTHHVGRHTKTLLHWKARSIFSIRDPVVQAGVSMESIGEKNQMPYLFTRGHCSMCLINWTLLVWNILLLRIFIVMSYIC